MNGLGWMVYQLLSAGTVAQVSIQEQAQQAMVLLGASAAGAVVAFVIVRRVFRSRDTPDGRRQADIVFARLLAEGRGRIELPRFALESRLSLDDARRYLEAKARSLGGTATLTQAGQVVYSFT